MITEATNVAKLPFVEEYEEAEAKALIDKQFTELTGKPFNYRPAGYFIAAKIYIRPEEIKTIKDAAGKNVTLWRPPTSTADDKYQSVAALVCAVGPLAFKDRLSGKQWAEGPTCRVGDWVAIPRFESNVVEYRGVPIAIFADDRILGVIDDPADIKAVTMADRI